MSCLLYLSNQHACCTLLLPKNFSGLVGWGKGGLQVGSWVGVQGCSGVQVLSRPATLLQTLLRLGPLLALAGSPSLLGGGPHSDRGCCSGAAPGIHHCDWHPILQHMLSSTITLNILFVRNKESPSYILGAQTITRGPITPPLNCCMVMQPQECSLFMHHRMYRLVTGRAIKGLWNAV